MEQAPHVEEGELGCGPGTLPPLWCGLRQVTSLSGLEFIIYGGGVFELPNSLIWTLGF